MRHGKVYRVGEHTSMIFRDNGNCMKLSYVSNVIGMAYRVREIGDI